MTWRLGHRRDRECPAAVTGEMSRGLSMWPGGGCRVTGPRGREAEWGSGGKAGRAPSPCPRSGGAGKVSEEATGARTEGVSTSWWTERTEVAQEWLRASGKTALARGWMLPLQKREEAGEREGRPHGSSQLHLQQTRRQTAGVTGGWRRVEAV